MITPSFGLTATEPVTPKLSLDFTTASLDPRITITRALNTATVCDSSGYITTVNADLPRFNYDPISAVCKGLLVEEARTNQIQDSAFSAFTALIGNNVWINAVLQLDSTPNFATSPNNTQTAALLAVNTTSTNRGTQYRTGITTAGTYTNSCFAKAASTDTKCSMYVVGDTSATNGCRVEFTLTGQGSFATPVLTGTATTGVATIQRFKDDWYRCTVTATLAAPANVSFFCFPGTRLAQTTASQTLVWGAQLEAGTFATSYIPTSAGAATRNADVAAMTGADFSDWYNQSKGTFRVDAISNASGNRPIISADDNTANESLVIKTQGNAPTFEITDGGSPQASVAAGTVSLNETAFAYVSYDVDFFGIARPTARQVDTSGTVPTVDRLRIGADQAGNYFNNTIQQIQFWP